MPRRDDIHTILIVGAGPIVIGQGCEFDYCCVHAAFAAKELGFEAVMVNSNPETVSTDYDTSDILINMPTRHGPTTDEGKIRALATLHHVPLITTMTAACAAADAVAAMRATGKAEDEAAAWTVHPLQDYLPAGN